MTRTNFDPRPDRVNYETVVSVVFFVTVVLITMMILLGRPDLPKDIQNGYVVVGELKPGCQFILQPPDGGPKRVLRNYGELPDSDEFLFVITDEGSQDPFFSVVYNDPKLPYWQWDYKFFISKDHLWVLEPKEGNTSSGEFGPCRN